MSRRKCRRTKGQNEVVELSQSTIHAEKLPLCLRLKFAEEEVVR